MKPLFGGLFQDSNTDQPQNQTTTLQEPTSAEPAVSQADKDKNLVSSSVDPAKAQGMSALSHLDPRASQVLERAYQESKRIRQSFIEPEQLFLGLISDREIFKTLQEFSVDVAKIQRDIQGKEETGNFDGEPTLGEGAKQILEEAYTAAKKRDIDFISPEDILIVFLSKDIDATKSLKEQGVQKEKVEEKLQKNPEYKTGKKSVLSEFGVDLTQKAKDGKLDPITGRDTETQRLIHILLRRSKNNPIIIGEAGVGKTAIVEGLALLIAEGKVPADLAKKRIIQLDISSLIAGASHRGEFEERLQNVIKETMDSNGEIILFIDEIHTIIGAGDTGGSLDASNIVKPYLSRGQLQIIGTTTTAEYRKNFEKDRAFERRFQSIMCNEPTDEVALDMLKVLQPKYEKFHNVTFSPESMTEAVKLSRRYIGERYLPDKAIDLLDEAASEVKLSIASGKRGENVIKPEDIQDVVSRWTGIPITKLTEKESEKLLHLEDLIHKSFVNHDRAVIAVAEAVRRGRIGLANANRPIASFIFLGPTGTGKTELAKVLAEIMFGRKDAMIRLDMSEYMEKHEVAKLVGAPPGYVGYEEGGQLTEAVRVKPYSIVLLDEIEKAHPDVFNILLQLLEDGRLTDNKGNTISFKNTVIIATSNIGSNLIREKLSAHKEEQANQAAQPEQNPQVNPAAIPNQVSPQPGTPSQATTQPKQANNQYPSSNNLINNDAIPEGESEAETKLYKELYQTVMGELTKHFKPEVLNRFDEVVVFEPLSAENMMLIAKLGIENTKKMLKDQNIGLEISQNAIKQLAKEGYDPAYGARPLRRLIQRSIENPIAIYLIQRAAQGGDTILVDYDPGKDQFTFSKRAGQVNPQAPQPSQPQSQVSQPQAEQAPTPPVQESTATPVQSQPQASDQPFDPTKLAGINPTGN